MVSFRNAAGRSLEIMSALELICYYLVLMWQVWAWRYWLELYFARD